MSRSAALGFDVGTTAVKAGLLWLEGDEPMLTAARPIPTVRPRPGWVEQDPHAWSEAMAACWAELRATAGPLELCAVGVCSQVNTHLVVDERLRPLRPAITWQDVRGAAEASELDAAADARRTELWGGPFTIDASFPLVRLLWLERHEPAHRAAASWLLLPKDYCIAVLTGEVASDGLSQVGLAGADGHYLDGVVELVPAARELLPPLRQPDETVALTRAGNPLDVPAGIPVATSTMDAWASFFGAGLLRAGRALDLAGTSEVVGVASRSAAPVAGIVSFPPVGGLNVHAGPTQAGGAALEWVAGLVSRSLPDALAAAEEAARDPQPVVFLPHLAGERAPYWNPDARGALIGLTTMTGPGQLVLATLEGVACAVRMLLEGCEQAAGLEAPSLRIAGGAARSTLWNQLKADATGRPVEVLDAIDVGVLGAALMGLVAAGLGTDVPALAEERVRVAATLDPRPEQRARLDDLYALYSQSYRALEPLFPRFSGR